MPTRGYTTVALPNFLIDQIDAIVKEKKYGYVSRPDFIKESLREKIRDFKR